VYSAAYYHFVSFHGQKEARLTNDQTVYGLRPRRTYLIKSSSIFLFYAPELHLKGAHDLRVRCLCTKNLFDRA